MPTEAEIEERAKIEERGEAHIARMKLVVEGLVRPGSDWRAGLSCLISEVERHDPGFIQRVAARDTLRRLGCD